MSAFAGGPALTLVVELFIKSSIILAAAMLGAGLLRRRSAALRHFLLSTFLVGLFFLPVLSALAPGWPAPWLPDRAAVRAESRTEARETVAGTERAMTGFRGEPRVAAASLDFRDDGPGAGLSRFRTALDTVVPGLWLAGLMLILARLMAGLLGVRRLTGEAEALDDPAWKHLLQRFMSAVRLNRRVEIKAHPRVLVPLTWGFRRPVVIMPSGTSAWSADAQSSALFHELSHVKRGDFLVMLAVRLSLALFWFNPLFWVAYKMLRTEQEKACDELVLKAGIRPSTYADNLLSFMQSMRLTRSPLAVFPGVLGLFGRSQLRDRLLAILGQKIAFKEVPMKAKVTVTVLVFLTLAFIGLARPRGAAATPETGLVAPGEAASATAAVAQAAPAQDAQKAAEKRKKDETKSAPAQEKEKKVRKEFKIVVDDKETGKEPIEITVIDGKTRKVIRLDGSAIVIKKSEDGKMLLMSPEGRELAVIGGEGTRLEINGGKMIRFDDEDDFETEGGRTVIVKTRSHREAVEEGEEPEHITIRHGNRGDREIVVEKRRVTAEPHDSVEVEQEELQDKLAETQALLKKIEAQKLAESSLAAQQESLKELEHSLQVLEEELNKAEQNLKTLKVVAEPEVYVTVPDAKSSELKIQEYRSGEKTPVHRFAKTHGDEAYSVALTMKDNSKETYDKAVAKLKQGLPQGYELESKFDEASGTMTFRITAKNGTEEGREKVETLIKELQSEPKK